MKILVLLAHPDKNSFNHAIAQTVVDQLELSGHKVFFHDLYEEGFDPLLPAEEIPSEAKLPPEIDSHCWELALAEGIVIVHPNWWGQPPAILKGWVDRVVRPEVAYRFLEGDGGEGVPVGLLKAQTAVVLNTSNTPGHREDEVFGDPLDILWRECIFGLCGVEFFHRRMFRVVCTSTEEERRGWLTEIKQLVKSAFNE
ncbi:NAD(P)H dehydrogenase (quinone) [Desulfatibacillum aliphaticivorans]|uniref:NAD(P)H dehydrogenase (Quinone) n=1 Tax=Desulfatibacillum aliphaticivorans TaxID=218208 RepID=B8FHY5_DESAL|nr:NAD(P)H-dependent oxidoreductase [Desulfatibacillum aliphaticivorans]ACL02552.1 NAD(P)H dehydrogenase (quinone) [Desulfatibacillum aliphaticivorans]